MEPEPVHAEDPLPRWFKLHSYLQSPNLSQNSGTVESKFTVVLNRVPLTTVCQEVPVSCWLFSHPRLHASFSGSFTAPWSSMLQSSEQYCLAWESKYLMELGSTLDTLLNGFVNMMAQEALKLTVFSGKNPNRIGSATCAVLLLVFA